jgi:hypothetical protein
MEMTMNKPLDKTLENLPKPDPREDIVTKEIEQYTASVPSTMYLAVAVGAMGLSLALQLAGRGKWGNFVAQWVPTWLIIGLYNKIVKVQGHDRTDRGKARQVSW